MRSTKDGLGVGVFWLQISNSEGRWYSHKHVSLDFSCNECKKRKEKLSFPSKETVQCYADVFWWETRYSGGEKNISPQAVYRIHYLCLESGDVPTLTLPAPRHPLVSAHSGQMLSPQRTVWEASTRQNTISARLTMEKKGKRWFMGTDLLQRGFASLQGNVAELVVLFL